jgi:TetR/AcrR family transcriptional repressor of nem operon
MARPKEFNPEEAMQEAMEAFWEHGYHATSVNSLYGTFGDKKKLFLAALAEYEKQGREIVREALERPGSARNALEDWVRTMASGCTGEAGLRGCLALKAAMEMAPQDSDVADWVRQVMRDREHLVAKVIRRAQADGEINARLDARAVARYLISCLTGLKVLGTSSPSQRDVREVITLILKTLD